MTRVLPLSLLLVACNLAPKPVEETSDTADTGAGGAGGTGIGAIQSGEVIPGTVVTLEGLVVTSGLTRDGEGFFVADPAGGPRSGLYVFGGPALVGDPTFQAGDEVTLTGEVQDFFGWMELKINGYDAVTVTGEAAVPAPVDLGDGAGVNWNDYESVAVTLRDQDVVGIDSYNTATLSSGVMLDDGFQYLELQCGGSFETISGIVFYRYEKHSVNPRSDSDMAGYVPGAAGTSTLADVQSGETCGDVTLEGVVATSPDYVKPGTTTSLFFVQDPSTGDGVAVFVKNSAFDVAVGDVFTLTGSVSEYYEMTQIVIEDIATIRKTGTDSPQAVTLSSAPSDWEPYEGRLITVEDVEVTGEPNYGQVSTNYADLFIDDLFVRFDATTGTRFGSVTGVLYYAFGEWKLEPRSESDLVAAP